MLSSASRTPNSILVIRGGALGDLIFCGASFQDIRRAYPRARITLLVRAAFAPFARSMPWFDDILIDPQPRASDVAGWRRLVRAVRALAPDIVFDLQGKTRQSVLYALLGGPWGPRWSGAAPLCALPRPWPPRPDWHFVDFLAAQLRAAHVPDSGPVDWSWLDAPAGHLSLPGRYAVLIPGCSPGAAFKRWPPEKYAALAKEIGMPCLIAGSKADADIATTIRRHAPEVLDLCGRTTLPELGSLLRRASLVVGNDTGPTHIAGAVGAPALALFSGRGNPVWSHPPGAVTAWRQCEDLKDLPVDEVTAAARDLLARRHSVRAG